MKAQIKKIIAVVLAAGILACVPLAACSDKGQAEIQTTTRITARTIIHPTLPMAIRVKLGTAMRILAEIMTAETTNLRQKNRYILMRLPIPTPRRATILFR